MKILAFDENAAKCYGNIRCQLEKQGQITGPLDLLIAAHAMSEQLIIVTMVVAVAVLINAGRIKGLQPTRKIIRELERRHGNEIAEIFGIVPGALTANEANYLIGFRSADEIRNRLAKAKKETYLRLRSKGIERQS